MKNIRDSIKLFRFNLVYNLLFEIVLKTVSFAILVPLYYAFVNLAVGVSGINYLSKETVARFFRAPSTYGFLFIMLVFGAMYITINVAGISYAYSRANYLKKTGPVRMLIHGLSSSLRILRPRNLPIFILTLCFFPVIGTVFLNFRLLNIRAPYIVDIITANIYLAIGVLAVYVVFIIFSLRYVFVLHIYYVDKVSFRKSIDRNKEVLKPRRIRTILGTVTWCVLFIALPAFINYLYTGPLLRWLIRYTSSVKITGMIYEVVKIVCAFAYVVLGLPLILSYICNNYYNMTPELEGPNIDNYEQYDAKKSSKKERRIFAIILVLALLLDTGFYVLRRNNVISINADYMDTLTITAHRGDSSQAPENTLSAFEKAIDNEADVIELDVRETKDGEIIVMHDENLKRTCGVNKKVGKLTYEELMEYSPAAKYKGPDKELYKDEKIPTLREVIEQVGDRAELNIELKPAKTDKDFEKKVVEIIQEYEYQDNCVVTSLVYKSIKKIKKADPSIKTVYVMAVAMGDFYNLEYADAFSIKYRYINTDVVKNAHKNGKEIYAWTVDSKDILESMMLLDVDSIITNNPDDMRRSMYENYYGDTLIKRINNYVEKQL